MTKDEATQLVRRFGKLYRKDKNYYAFNYDYNYCFYIGCASNVIVIEGEQQFGLIADNGFVRTSFFFGVPWLLIYFILIYRNSKSKVLPILYYLTI